MRDILAAGQREDRALATLLAGCLLIFVAQGPRLAREAQLMPDGPPLEALMTTTLFTWLLVWPILFYVLAALSHLGARVLGGRGSWFGARMALFWTVLAVTPMMLLDGLVRGLIGPGSAASLTGGAALFAFVVIWAQSLHTAETLPPEPCE